MTRRSRSFLDRIRSSPSTLYAVLVLGGLGLLVENIDKILPILLTILGGGALTASGYFFVRQHNRHRAKAQLQDRLVAQMSQHEAALVSYFRQSISKDAFGNVDDCKWRKHIETFLSMQVMPYVPNYSAWRNSRTGEEAANIVDRFTRQQDEFRRSNCPLSAIEAHQISPSEYEQLCADILKGIGWQARVTQSSRDHGADVIAEKRGVRVVIQCKRYSQPVGNKAVQEAHSALSLYAGNVACVVAPSGFTSQARREANGLNIHLLHHSDLEELMRQIETKERSQHLMGI